MPSQWNEPLPGIVPQPVMVPHPGTFAQPEMFAPASIPASAWPFHQAGPPPISGPLPVIPADSVTPPRGALPAYPAPPAYPAAPAYPADPGYGPDLRYPAALALAQPTVYSPAPTHAPPYVPVPFDTPAPAYAPAPASPAYEPSRLYEPFLVCEPGRAYESLPGYETAGAGGPLPADEPLPPHEPLPADEPLAAHGPPPAYEPPAYELPGPAAPPPPPAPDLPPPAQRWRRVFAGQEAELRRIRSWLAELLPSGPAREDIVTVTIELAANAVRHTASGGQGFFAVELTWQVRPVTVRVAVADGGARTSPHLEPGTDPLGPGPLGIGSPGVTPLSLDQLDSAQLSEHGRGLRVVRALAERTGVCGDHRGRLVWAEIRWNADGAAQPDFPDGYEASLRDIRVVLAARYPEADIWFGRATMQWWALIGRPEKGRPEARRLLTAESPADLAQLLDVARATAKLARGRSRGRHGVTGRRAGPELVGPPASRPRRGCGQPSAPRRRPARRGPDPGHADSAG